MTIVDDPQSDNYPVPEEIVSRINSQMSTLKIWLPNIDTEHTAAANLIVIDECEFVTLPTVSQTGDSSITISTELEQSGWLYAVAMMQGVDSEEPSPK